MSERLLLRGGTVVPVDPASPSHLRADVLVVDGRIAALGPDLPVSDAAVLDVAGAIVAPGLVDSHRHVWQSLLRLVGADWTIADYGSRVFGRYGPRYTPADLYLATRLGLAEALDAGITQVFDWCHNLASPEHADAVVQAHRDSRARVVLGYGQSAAAWHRTYDDDVPDPLPDPDLRRLRSASFAGDDGLTGLALAARGPEKVGFEVAVAEWQLARELGLRISVHVGNGVRARSEPVRRLHERGLLGPDTTYVHCSSTSDAELALIAASGGTASCAPAVESQMGHGRPALHRLRAAGVPASLSVDTCVAVGGDLFGAMRAGLAAARAEANAAVLEQGTPVSTVDITVAEVLELATLGGARANGLDGRTGSLVPGKDADLIVVDATAVNLAPVADPVAALVLGAHPGNVDTVLVRGRVVKRGGRLVDADLAALVADAGRARDRILSERSTVDSGGWR